MATLLEDELERHEGPEPRVRTEDVQKQLRRVVRPGEEDGGDAVAQIAARAKVSPRTVYRVLNPKENRPTISLDLADRLCLAVGVHLAYCCKLVWPDGSVTDYVTGNIEPLSENRVT